MKRPIDQGASGPKVQYHAYCGAAGRRIFGAERRSEGISNITKS